MTRPPLAEARFIPPGPVQGRRAPGIKAHRVRVGKRPARRNKPER